jgi:tRNA(fMet)-specific endonuclease VapC
LNKSLLDTDIYSEMVKGVNANVVRNATLYRSLHGHYTLSTVTVVEAVMGFHKQGREDRVQHFLSGLPYLELLTLGLESAELAGRIYADLERTGQTIGIADTLIAAIALQNDLVLVTGNTSHYQRIQNLGYGLKLANWRDPVSP